MLILLILLVCVSCETSTSITLDGNNPPTFTFSGTGTMTFLTVSEVAPENQTRPDVEQDLDKNPTIWWIYPSQVVGGPVKKVAPITYGRLPSGFSQKIPESGSAPPKLVEGKIYDVWMPMSGAESGHVRFVIRDGKSLPIRIPTR